MPSGDTEAAMRDAVSGEAARWAIRLADGPLDDRADADLARWLAEEPSRAGALLRAEACLAYVESACALDRGIEIADEEEDARADIGPVPAFAPSRRRAVAAFAGVTIAAIGIGIAAMLPRRDTVYATARGEVRRIQLEDGSSLSINTASEVTADLSDSVERRLAVRRGEAWFQVRHDRTRPFVVAVADVRVRALGTAFSVRLREAGVDILVTDGVVEAWRANRPDRAVRIAAGQSGFVAHDAPMPVVTTPPASLDTIERQLAWRSGELALDGETLGQAAAEINRYNRVQVIVDPALAGQTLVGYFRTNDPEGFATGAASLVDGRVEREGDSVRIVP